MTNDASMDWASSDLMWMSRHLDTLRKTYQTECRTMLLALIDVLDTLERMNATADGAVALPTDWRDGMGSLEGKLRQTLAELDVERVADAGPVDPTVHEVIEVTQPTEAHAAPETIAQVTKAGYLWKGQLLRPAEVVAVQRRD